MRPGRRHAMLSVAACAGLILAGCGAGNADETSDDDDRPLVLTTFTVIADIAQNVAGDHLRVESLIPVGAEVHSYEPTPGDLRTATEAELILDNGLDLELWFEQFIADVDAPRVMVTEGVDPIDIAADAYAGRPNPHAWMSPPNVQIYVANIAAAFSELVPEHAGDFAQNAEAYNDELDQVHTELVDRLAELPEPQRALVTCEGAFSYLARDAGMAEQYLWPVNAESEATPQRIARTIAFVEEHQVPAVFCESTVSDAAMQQVVEATDTEFGGVLYVDSLTDADGPVPTYLDLIRYDVATIVDALTGSDSPAA